MRRASCDHEVVEVDRLGDESDMSLVGAGEIEEIFDDLLHADDVVEQALESRGPARIGVVSQLDLELRSQPGERAPQLMRCVGDKAPLEGYRTFEAGQHLVHGVRQSVDFVAGIWSGNPAVQIGGTDGGHLGSHLLDGVQRTPDQPPHQAGEGRHHDRDDHQ